MSFRLKAAGEQELKICNRNGGYPAGAGEVGGQGAQSSRGWRDGGGGGFREGETLAKREPATSMFKFEPEREGGAGRVEPVETTASQEGSYSQYVARARPSVSSESLGAAVYASIRLYSTYTRTHTRTYIYTHCYIYAWSGAPVSRVSRP